MEGERLLRKMFFAPQKNVSDPEMLSKLFLEF